MNIADNIKAERERLGISQKKLGEIVGVDQSHISHMESGMKVPSASMLLMLADVFNVSTDKLYGREVSAKSIEKKIGGVPNAKIKNSKLRNGG